MYAAQYFAPYCAPTLPLSLIAMSTYAFAHIAHLFFAIVFVGGVFFEALILSALRGRQVSREARREVDKAISARAVRVMPWIVAGVFLSGLILAHQHRAALSHPLASAFGMQLAIKIALACSVLLHFVLAVRKMRRGTLTAAWSRYIHTAVLLHMVAIVLLAKTMLYVH